MPAEVPEDCCGWLDLVRCDRPDEHERELMGMDKTEGLGGLWELISQELVQNTPQKSLQRRSTCSI